MTVYLFVAWPDSHKSSVSGCFSYTNCVHPDVYTMQCRQPVKDNYLTNAAIVFEKMRKIVKNTWGKRFCEPQEINCKLCFASVLIQIWIKALSRTATTNLATHSGITYMKSVPTMCLQKHTHYPFWLLTGQASPLCTSRGWWNLVVAKIGSSWAETYDMK